MLAPLAFTAFFMLLHVVVRWRSDRPFDVDLRLSRGRWSRDWSGPACNVEAGAPYNASTLKSYWR